MFKISLTVFLFCFLQQLEGVAQAVKTSLSFRVIGPKESGVNLYTVKDGKAVSLGFQRPDGEGKGAFQLDENKEGIYFLAKAGGKGGDYKYTLYLKKGQSQHLDLYLDRTSVDYDSCVVKNPNAETAILQNWTNSLNEYTKAVSLQHIDSYTQYDTFALNAEQFLKRNQTKNHYFNRWLKDKIETDLLYLRAANFFGFNKRLAARYDSSATAAPFYRPLLKKEIVSNPTLLRSEHGQGLLDYVFAYWKFNQDPSGTNLKTMRFSENIPLISNDAVKAAYIVAKMPQINRYEDFLQQVEPYKAFLTTEEHQRAYQKKYEALYLFAKGTPGYNFNLMDTNGKTYTLDSFKGKILILDMWAMWCAPCLAEKPVMEKIAAGYENRDDIAFVGVSVDGLNRREIWRNFVKKNGFTTIELLSNATESIQKYYKIEGIPRFLIFDRQGKIITVDAPRPSNPGFKKILDQALAEK